MKRYFLVLMLIFGNLLWFTSCRNDELDTNSIFIDPPFEGADSEAYSFLLDRWLSDNYLLPYNLQFRYRLEDVGSDMNYNLVPTSYEKSIDMAVLVKYLWFDVYGKVVSENFLKKYGPRIIHLIGSPEFNPANGTIVLGVAEGGLKVTLTQCNALDVNDLDFANEQFFKTMHHEFAHILHQKKGYPKEFNLLSPGFYEPFSWQERPDEIAHSLGFASRYGGSANQEDFVEIIANYIVKTDAQWAEILEQASKEWQIVLDKNGELVTLSDGVDGKALLLQKLTICKKWLHEAWDIDLDTLHEEVQRRQMAIPMDSLRKQLTENYPH